MHILNMIFYALLEMSIIASIIGGVILIIKKLVKSRISPKWVNVLWCVFLVVLINPVRIESEFSIWNVFNYENISITENVNRKEALDKHTKEEALGENTLYDTTNEEVTNYCNVEVITTVSNIVVTVYFVVVAIQIIISILTNININKKTRKRFNHKRLNMLLDKAKGKLCIKSKIELINQQLISTPSIYGIMHTKIFLKEDILNLSDKEIELILMHELSHMKNGDIFLNKILYALKIIYFFNPVILIMISEIKKDIELANDERIIENITNNDISTYCKTLLKISLSLDNKISLGLGIVGRISNLEERIKMIKEKNNFIKNKVILICIVTALVFGITICFATNKIFDYPEEIKDIELEKVEVSNEIKAPLEGVLEITANYGTRVHPISKQIFSHNGIDFKADNGENVLSITNGLVENTGYNSEYGNFIEIRHKDFYSFYAHLSSIDIKIGENTEAGQKIGEVGSTGKATGPNLHFEIRDLNKNAINPEGYVNIEM